MKIFTRILRPRAYYSGKKTSKLATMLNYKSLRPQHHKKMKQIYTGLSLALLSFLFVVFMVVPFNNIDSQSRKEVNLVASFLAGMFGFAAIEQLRKI